MHARIVFKFQDILFYNISRVDLEWIDITPKNLLRVSDDLRI